MDPLCASAAVRRRGGNRHSILDVTTVQQSVNKSTTDAPPAAKAVNGMQEIKLGETVILAFVQHGGPVVVKDRRYFPTNDIVTNINRSGALRVGALLSFFRDKNRKMSLYGWMATLKARTLTYRHE